LKRKNIEIVKIRITIGYAIKYGVIAFIIASWPDIGFMIGKIDISIDMNKKKLTRIMPIVVNPILYDRVKFIHSSSFESGARTHGE
jgi:hypothetical protein